MVVNSVLPSLLNVAQIVNIVAPQQQHQQLQPNNDQYYRNHPPTSTVVNGDENNNILVGFPYKQFVYSNNNNKDRQVSSSPTPPISTIPKMEILEFNTMNVGKNKYADCTPETIAVQSERILSQLFRSETYDKHLIPDPRGVNVSIELAVQAFYDVSETSASFTADVLMSQIWQDRRLRYAHMSGCLQNLTLSSAIVDRLWQPFVCFVNSKKSDLHISPSANTFVLIYPNGTIWMNFRLRVEGPCYVDLTQYPFNEEECELVLESYAYNAANVRLNWRAWNPVFEYPSRTKMPDFTLSEIRWAKHSFVYAAGKWDQLTVNFFLTRQYGVYIFQMYFPVQTAVAMSWIPFFLDHRSLPARITLAVSALMSITFQYGNILKSLPRVSYVMSVDVWIFTGIAFVAGSLIELAIVGHLHRCSRNRRLSTRRRAHCYLTDEREQGMAPPSSSIPASPAESAFTATPLPYTPTTPFPLPELRINAAAYGTFDGTEPSFTADIEPIRLEMARPHQLFQQNGGSALLARRGGARKRGGAYESDRAEMGAMLGDRAEMGAMLGEDIRLRRETLGGKALRRRANAVVRKTDRPTSRLSNKSNKTTIGKLVRSGTVQLKNHLQNMQYTVYGSWSDPLFWDERARLYFPLAYMIFNIAYWSYYVGFHKFLRPWMTTVPPNDDAIMSSNA